MKSPVDDLVVTCDEMWIHQRSTNQSRDRMNFWLISVVLLSISCLLLFLVIVVNYCIKCG